MPDENAETEARLVTLEQATATLQDQVAEVERRLRIRDNQLNETTQRTIATRSDLVAHKATDRNNAHPEPAAGPGL